jgi:hypothetical protein
VLGREQLTGMRVVADPTAIDALVRALPAGATILRFARDEALLIGFASVQLDDPHAIVEPETGFVALTLEREHVARHVEWPLPLAGAVGQGKVAGVPAKLAWLPDGRAWVVTQAAFVDDLIGRLEGHP